MKNKLALKIVSGITIFLMACIAVTLITNKTNKQISATQGALAILSKGTKISSTSFYTNIKNYGAVGDNTTNDTAAIQKAINATPEGGTIFIPVGSYRITGTLTLTHGINIIGEGYRAILSVDSSVGANTDILFVHPSVHAANSGPLGDTAPDGSVYAPFRFQDFAIAPRTWNTTPGRYAINLDGQGFAQFREVVIEHIMISQLGSSAIYANNTHNNGSPMGTSIEHCVLYGGIKIQHCGDTVQVRSNVILGKGKALDVDFQMGASTFVFENNNIQSDEGVLIRGTSGNGAYGLQIIGNEFESTPTFTGGENKVFVDINGSSDGIARGTIIMRNSFQKPNAYGALDSIRINYSDQAIIQDNVFGAGVGSSKDIVITPNAVGTVIGLNMWPWGNGTVIIDNGVGTARIATEKW